MIDEKLVHGGRSKDQGDGTVAWCNARKARMHLAYVFVMHKICHNRKTCLE